jgi:hypothetical protein
MNNKEPAIWNDLENFLLVFRYQFSDFFAFFGLPSQGCQKFQNSKPLTLLKLPDQSKC